MEVRLEGLKVEGFCVFIYGLPGAGKTTLARALADEVEDLTGKRALILDGDELRRGISLDLEFGPQDRKEHARRVASMAALLVEQGQIVIVALVAPVEAMRQEFRKRIRRLVEVFLDCPITVCRGRDKKGIYERADAGLISYVPGIDMGFERVEATEVCAVVPPMSVRGEVEVVMGVVRGGGWLHVPESGGSWTLIPGRFQPFHSGHQALAEVILKRGGKVAFGIRDTVESEKNPYSYRERKDMIMDAMSDWGERALVVKLPDIGAIVVGRRPGFRVGQIRLGGMVETISGTELRG